MKLVVLLVCFLLSICATVTSLVAWKGIHEASAAVPTVMPPLASTPAPRSNTQELDALTSQIATLTAEVNALKDASATTTTPAAASATAATPALAIDDAKLKEMIRAELQNQFRMLRGGGFNRDDPTAIQRQLQEQLSLDPAKATQVAALISSERAAVRAIYQNSNGASREELAPKVKDERDKLDIETTKVLTADEQTKLAAWLDRAGTRRPRPDAAGNAGNGTAGAAAPAAPGQAAPGGAPATTPAPGPSSF